MTKLTMKRDIEKRVVRAVMRSYEFFVTRHHHGDYRHWIE